MKTINKLIAVLFVTALLFTGCSREEPESSDISTDITDVEEKDVNNEEKPDITENDDPEEEEPVASKGGIYTEAGMEMRDFYSAFNEAMEHFARAVNNYETDDFDLFNVGGDFIVPTGNIVSTSQYDYLESGDNPKETGKNGSFDAIREKNGDIITFSQSMTNEEDGFGRDDLKGDVKESHGTLNIETNTLILEGTTTRDGQVIARTVNEVVMLPDGTFLAQCIDKPKKPTDDRIEDKGIARFVYCSKDKLEIITANFDPDVNFTYESIVGKPEATPETMSEGYKKVRQLLVENDEATAMKY